MMKPDRGRNGNRLHVTCTVAALAAACIGQAHAQAGGGSGVQIYGKASVGLDMYKATGATAGPASDIPRVRRLYDAGSRLGFRGTEALGNGLSAHFVIEGGFNMDNGGNIGPNGRPNTSTGTLGSRTTYVGLKSDTLGTLRFGRQDLFWTSPYINQTGSDWVSSGFGVQSGGIGRGMAVGVVRVNDTVKYISPRLFGLFEVIVGASTTQRETISATTRNNGSLWALTLQGTKGPFGYGYDYARNRGNELTAPSGSLPAGTQGQSEGHKLRLRYSYSDSGQVSLILLQSQVTNGGASLNVGATADPSAHKLRQRGLVLGMSQYFGEGKRYHFIAEYMHLANISGCNVASRCDDTGAHGYLLAFRYLLSKRTNLYVNYQKILNDRNYNLDWNGNNMSSAPSGLPVGADPQLVGIGIMHRF
ncbi:putative porin [Pigmentiphaga kullae]|uniref:Putative porin n=2 Tax=Pigmentiphaga kullae TaxID=151784 RepID=A0A4V2F2B7_9BURK|nr:putative porin [Pigmentiphaga kullae]